MRAMDLLFLILTGCGFPPIPLDLRVSTDVDLPPLEEGTMLELSTRTKDTHSRTYRDASCLVDPGWCELQLDVSMMGCRYPELCLRRLEGTLWLDLDGDDDGDELLALVDGDPIAYFDVEIAWLPLEEPLEIVLDWPEAVLEAD